MGIVDPRAFASDEEPVHEGAGGLARTPGIEDDLSERLAVIHRSDLPLDCPWPPLGSIRRSARSHRSAWPPNVAAGGSAPGC